ncbi:hypothetical protein EW145_g2254 [Phellinidium pouzarii]|uniref:Uncharacterized protein n=1 Tax=Phellinidium pouzarii TaxID=167371 RepID=A0A4S4LH18_9AGAM|nr:hypothetical protein EW145_g2254 [Phellinidium pouzarii]
MILEPDREPGKNAKWKARTRPASPLQACSFTAINIDENQSLVLVHNPPLCINHHHLSSPSSSSSSRSSPIVFLSSSPPASTSFGYAFLIPSSSLFLLSILLFVFVRFSLFNSVAHFLFPSSSPRSWTSTSTPPGVQYATASFSQNDTLSLSIRLRPKSLLPSSFLLRRPPAVRQSQTSRCKNGTIKVRAGGGGLVHGTGRVRPGGGLRTNTGNKNKSPLRQETQLAEAQAAAAAAAPAAGPVRMRTVIDQEQTPLYCSDECRQADLDMSWPVAPPSARAVLDAEFDGHLKYPNLGAHPSQLNPARASPPPASHTAGLDESRSALTLPGVDPELYAGKRLSTPRRSIAKGVEGLLLVPDILLHRTPAPAAAVSRSLPSAGIAAGSMAQNMRRSGSEASVSRKNERRSSKRSTSKLGAVRESDEGIWHRMEEVSEDSRSAATSSSGKTHSKHEKVSCKAGKACSTMSEKNARDKVGLKTEDGLARNRSPSKVEGPMYNIVPPLPVKQTRCEEIFVPDELPAPVSHAPVSTSAPTSSADAITYEGKYIAISNLHTRDIELGRRALREIGKRRGMHETVPGWWVEHEWEVTVIPEPKRLFFFGNEAGRTR